jgi:hypothetical protein
MYCFVLLIFEFQIFGCFFAYETRHVTITALNDSKHIGICVYNVLLMCTTGSVISFIVKNKNISFVLITIFIFCCTSVTLFLVFIPKVILNLFKYIFYHFFFINRFSKCIETQKVKINIKQNHF